MKPGDAMSTRPRRIAYRFVKTLVSKRTPLFNGALECRLFEYKMVAGDTRGKKPEA
jgi:putative N6-adenine-specific DNA methylase